jgi:hypothetical protein
MVLLQLMLLDVKTALRNAVRKLQVGLTRHNRAYRAKPEEAKYNTKDIIRRLCGGDCTPTIGRIRMAFREVLTSLKADYSRRSTHKALQVLLGEAVIGLVPEEEGTALLV